MLENEYSKTTEEYFWNMPFIFSNIFYFLWAVDMRNKKEEEERLFWLKKIEIHKTTSLAYDISLPALLNITERALEAFESSFYIVVLRLANHMPGKCFVGYYSFKIVSSLHNFFLKAAWKTTFNFFIINPYYEPLLWFMILEVFCKCNHQLQFSYFQKCLYYQWTFCSTQRLIE